jgi:DNA-binding transcriptional LysR family regulator
MQLKNWNDLRYLLAVKRGRSLAAAARQIGVDDTTVSRRLAALQSSVGAQLYRRLPDGSLQLTSQGEAVACRVEYMDHQIDLIAEICGSSPDQCVGSVRLTSVPIIINRLLTPQIGQLLTAHAKLDVELVPDSRDLSLTRREADISIRLARPTTGGSNVKAWRIGDLNYAVYTSRDYSAKKAAGLPWITYDETMARLPQAQWIARVTKGQTSQLSGLRVHDAETAFEAAIAGIGRALLPSVIANRDDRLMRFNIKGGIPLPSREIWLLAHADQLELRRIRAVISWIEKLFNFTGRE